MSARDIALALHGRPCGDEWIARCPVPGHGQGRGDKNPSLSIRDDNGTTLFHCHGGCSQEQVINALKARHLWPELSGSIAPPRQRVDSWTPIQPIPIDAPPPPSHPRLGKPSTQWAYRDREGGTIFFVCRFDSDAGKDVLPLVFAEGPDGRRGWRWKGLPVPRPLYCLDRLAARPDAPVVVTEGEKAADAAQKLFPDHVAVTSPNGSDAAGRADWSPMEGRQVMVWPDADEKGAKYASDVARLCRDAGAKLIRFISPPKSVKGGWDSADAEDEDWTARTSGNAFRGGSRTPRELSKNPPTGRYGGRFSGPGYPAPRTHPDAIPPIPRTCDAVRQTGYRQDALEPRHRLCGRQ